MKLRKKKSKAVEYHVSFKGCDIKFKTENGKRHKYIELTLTGLAKLLVLVRDRDDWGIFTELMQAVVEELDVNARFVEEKPTKIERDYVV